MSEHNERPPAASYVDKVRGDMQKYVRTLISDNESLRIGMARLEAELHTLHDELNARDSHERELRQLLDGIKAETERHLREYADLEQANANLANLYVASYQLHGTLDREVVLASIQEIIVNLVGSEEFALYELDEASGNYACIAALGATSPDAANADSAVRNAVSTGAAYLANDGDGSSVVACVPLKLDGRVTGYVAIFRLLGHKQGLEPLDHELFDLLATHAATALYCTSLHEKVRATERMTA